MKKKQVLILFSDTGGGHRSAAEAVVEALEMNYPKQFEIKMLDVLKEYAPRPLNHLPSLYPDMVRFPALWEMGYRLTDGPHRVSAINRTGWPYVRRAVRRMLAEHQADIVVSVHPLFVAPFCYASKRGDMPFFVLVTDLVSTHSLWYHPEADLTLVPTKEARVRAIQNGVPADKIQVTGLPVARRFSEPVCERDTYRQALGWPPDLPMVLLVGGGEGMGPILATASAIAELDCELGLAIVAGRNTGLEQRLKSHEWDKSVFVYGFEHRMSELMRAADMIVTKAGPGTITEAINAHLPLVLYSRLPGQEDGNVDFVINHELGVWAPDPDQASKAVRRWIDEPEDLKATARRCAAAAKPDAADRIAEKIAIRLGVVKKLPEQDGIVHLRT